MIYHTDILLSSDIFLDSLIIDIHVLQFIFVSAIVMLAYKNKFRYVSISLKTSYSLGVIQIQSIFWTTVAENG